MNVKTKKVLVKFAIFCLMQSSIFGAFTCKKGFSYKEDRGGSFEEVEKALEEKECIDQKGAVCIELKVDEITINGELKKNAVYMNCWEGGFNSCDYIFKKTVDELNQVMATETNSEIFGGNNNAVAGKKNAEGNCCAGSNCNTDFLKKTMEIEENEKDEEGKNAGTAITTKLGLLLSTSAVVLLACFNQ